MVVIVVMRIMRVIVMVIVVIGIVMVSSCMMIRNTITSRSVMWF